MKVFNLIEKSNVYTSNVFLITGSNNALSDINTLIDVGADESIIEKINNTSTGVGKKQIEQVVITHFHSDHVLILDKVIECYNPKIYAFSAFSKKVNGFLQNGDTLKIGDRIFEIIHIPGHSSDSICLYCEEEGVLFSGDAPLIITSTDGTYEEAFYKSMVVLSKKRISSIYFGHGKPLLKGCNEAIFNSLRNMIIRKK